MKVKVEVSVNNGTVRGGELIRYRLIGYIKSIYIPLIIIFVSHYCFGFNLFYIIMIFLFFIGDLCLIYKKR